MRLTSHGILAIQSPRLLLHPSRQARNSSPFKFDFQHRSSQASHRVTHSSCRRCFSSGLISKGATVGPSSNAGTSCGLANAPEVAANEPNKNRAAKRDKVFFMRCSLRSHDTGKPDQAPNFLHVRATRARDTMHDRPSFSGHLTQFVEPNSIAPRAHVTRVR